MNSSIETPGSYAWLDRNLRSIPGVMTYTSKSVDFGEEVLNVLIAPDADKETIRKQVTSLFSNSWFMVQLNIFQLTHHSSIGANTVRH